MDSQDYTIELNSNDPLYSTKWVTAQSLNQTSERIREINEEIYSKIYFYFSLIFTVFIAIFAELLNWLMVLASLDLSLGLLVYFASKFYTKRRELARDKSKIIKVLNQLGIPIKE